VGHRLKAVLGSPPVADADLVRQVLAGASVEESKEATLDAKSWLTAAMRKLKRELR
jgi:hypothetical protein